MMQYPKTLRLVTKDRKRAMRLRPPPRATETRSPTHRGMTDASSITGVDILLAVAQELQEHDVIEDEVAELYIQLLMNGFVIPDEQIATATMANSRQIARAPLSRFEDGACRIVMTALFAALEQSVDEQTQGELLMVGLSELVKYREYLASMGRANAPGDST